MNDIVRVDGSVTPELDRPRPDRLVSGNPLRTTWAHYEHRGMTSGIWSCEVGSWNIRFADNKDEFFCVIEGRVRLWNEAGTCTEVGPGEAAVIPCGFVGRFEVVEAVRKYFVVSEREGV
ncbi:cupin domain-containing protein [Chitinibacteraceae bacterium HSL-7]